MIVRERDLADGDEPGTEVLRNAWTLRPWERVVRRFHVGADRRGVFRLGPVDLSVGDPFASRAAADLRPIIDTFLVWPRTVPTTEIEPPDRWGDLERARSGLAEDPSRFAGVRPYAAGDPLRRIHARTSARMGRPMTKRFEPSREREVLIALDVQTVEGAAWEAGFGSDDVESLYVIAGSLARTLGDRRVAFGLMAAGYTGAETRIARVAVSSAPGQVQRVLDLLARLSAHASAPFERLLVIVARTVRPGTTVLVLTARDPRPFGPALRRLEQAGADVVVVAAARPRPTGRRRRDRSASPPGARSWTVTGARPSAWCSRRERRQRGPAEAEPPLPRPDRAGDPRRGRVDRRPRGPPAGDAPCASRRWVSPGSWSPASRASPRRAGSRPGGRPLARARSPP